MPHNLPNKYQNIFVCHVITKQISSYICIGEMAQIKLKMTFEGHFIQIFKSSKVQISKYLYSLFTVVTLEKGSLMLDNYVMHKLYPDSH